MNNYNIKKSLIEKIFWLETYCKFVKLISKTKFVDNKMNRKVSFYAFPIFYITSIIFLQIKIKIFSKLIILKINKYNLSYKNFEVIVIHFLFN